MRVAPPPLFLLAVARPPSSQVASSYKFERGALEIGSRRPADEARVVVTAAVPSRLPSSPVVLCEACRGGPGAGVARAQRNARKRDERAATGSVGEGKRGAQSTRRPGSLFLLRWATVPFIVGRLFPSRVRAAVVARRDWGARACGFRV